MRSPNGRDKGGINAEFEPQPTPSGRLSRSKHEESVRKRKNRLAMWNINARSTVIGIVL
jgi:hypothetical protein